MNYDADALNREFEALSRRHGAGYLPEADSAEVRDAIVQAEILLTEARLSQDGQSVLGAALSRQVGLADKSQIGMADQDRLDRVIGDLIARNMRIADTDVLNESTDGGGGAGLDLTAGDFLSERFGGVRDDIQRSVEATSAGSDDPEVGKTLMGHFMGRVHEKLCTPGAKLWVAVQAAVAAGTGSVLMALVALVGFGAAALPILVPVAAAIMYEGLPAFCARYAPD